MPVLLAPIGFHGTLFMSSSISIVTLKSLIGFFFLTGRAMLKCTHPHSLTHINIFNSIIIRCGCALVKFWRQYIMVFFFQYFFSQELKWALIYIWCTSFPFVILAHLSHKEQNIPLTTGCSPYLTDQQVSLYSGVQDIFCHSEKLWQFSAICLCYNILI